MGDFEIRIGKHLPETPDALQQGKTPVNYSRQAAVDYALFFCNRVVSDGVVMSKAKVNRRKVGALLSDIEAVSDENDCTHFVSCSLGKPPAFKTDGGVTLTGGGVHLSPDGFFEKGVSGVYGMLQPGPLVNYLKVTQKIAFARIEADTLSFSAWTPQFFVNSKEQVSALKRLVQDRFPDDLGKGDLVAYYADPEGSGSHSAVVVNDDWGIACHTGSRCGKVSIENVGHPFFIYARFKQFKEDVL